MCVCQCQEYARGGGTVENWAVPAVVYSLVSRCLRDGVSLLLNSSLYDELAITFMTPVLETNLVKSITVHTAFLLLVF